jgi:primosomal protein N' (replication factor Y)
MLVPEISLTSQTIERFKMRFSEKIAIIHHKRSSSEKFSDWQDLHSGKIKIVIGARSAIFAPLKNLGLIIVDEEHDSSYKQSEDSPTYNAKNLAVIRGKLSKALVILGSATPSIESFYNAKKNKYILSTLLTRPTKTTLPKVHIVDMKREKHFLFSEKLLSSIKKRLDLGEQVILFLNRRGYSNFLICSNCSNIIKCPHCDLSLTFHKNQNILLCHSCDYKIIPPKICPLCKSFQQEKKGYGTEKVEATLKAIFKGIRTLRMDKDTTSKKNSHEILFKEFKAGKADVLIGTQMIVKGLHFPSVTLVGVLNSDAALNIPDFRASENVFQLITQVAGRAGREDLEGEVIIQTNMPENSTIQLAAKQDFLSFYSKELENRKLFSYPPFSKIIKFTFLGLDENKTKIFAENFKNFLIKNLPSDTKIHPVIPSIRPKQKDFYRFILLIRGKNVLFLSKAIKEIQKNFHLPSSVKLFIDVDPIWCL